MKTSAISEKLCHGKASAGDLSAYCTVNKAQHTNMSPSMSVSYISINQTGMLKGINKSSDNKALARKLHITGWQAW
eukprot:8843181-Ditylum_brightwellii.AAC.1